MVGSFAIDWTAIRIRSWNWVARRVVHRQPGGRHDVFGGPLGGEVAKHGAFDAAAEPNPVGPHDGDVDQMLAACRSG